VTQHERFARVLSSIARRVSRLRSAEVCCGGLTPEQFETLRALEASTDPSMGRLSTALGVDLSTMSRNVSVLQREGYVERTRHPDDSRVVTVALTRKGANALETLRCDEKDVMAKLFNRIPAASRATALQALELVQTALEPEDEAGAACCAPEQPKKAAR
jgi:DNA-binding MarR family transcriptional regulator